MGNFCSNCGNQLREGANFCNKCGNQVNVISVVNFPSSQLTNYNQFQNGINQGGYSPNNNNQPYNYSEPIKNENLTWGTAVSNYWSCRFKGRCSRWEWWFTVLTFNIPFSALAGFGIFAFTKNYPTPGPFIIGIIILNLITLLPNLSFTARRLHDLNICGWWQILAYMPTIIGFSFGIYASKATSYNEFKSIMDLGTAIEIGGGIIVFIGALLVVFSSGTQGPNKYGPPSKY